MAQDSINVTFKVNEDGSLQQVEQKAKKAAAGIDKATKSSDHYSKKNKGVAGATSNSTKAFSKMTTGIEGGLVPAYAALAANVFAITAAFGALRRASAAEQLKEGLLFTGREAGQNLELVTAKLKEVTGAAVSTVQAMSAVAIGVSSGFDESQLVGLAQVAKGASLALGRDMGDAMDRLIRGAAKLEPEILDELGIMVRLDKATRDYADTMGVAVDKLTLFEKRMAFTNAIIEQGQNKFLALSQHMEANPFDQMAATFDNLAKGGINLANTLLGPLARFFAENMPAMIAGVTMFGMTVLKQMVPALTNQAKAAAEAAEAQSLLAKQQIAEVGQSKGRTKAAKILNQKIKDGTQTTKDYRKALRAEEIQMKRNKTMYDNGKISLEQYTARKNASESETNKYVMALRAEKAARGQSNQVEALALIQGGEMRQGLKLGLADLKDQAGELKTNREGMKGFTLQKQKLNDSLKMGAQRMRLFGSAALRAIPIIGQVAMAVTMLHGVFKKFFGQKPKFLDKALKDNKERLDEFPNVLNQLVETFDLMKSKNDAFVAGLKVTVGQLAQIRQGIVDIRLAEEADTTSDLVKQRLLVRDKQARFDKVSARNRRVEAGGPGNVDTKAEIVAGKQLKEAKAKLAKIQAQASVISDDAIQGARQMAEKGLVQLENILEVANRNENAQLSEIVTANIAGLEAARSAFAAAVSSEEGASIADLKILEQSIQQATIPAAALTTAIKEAGEATSKITAIEKGHQATTGLFKDDMDAIDKVLNLTEKMEGGQAALNERYQAAFDSYNIHLTEKQQAEAKILKDKKGELAAEKFIFDTKRNSLAALRDDMELRNKAAKNAQRDDQESLNRQTVLRQLGLDVLAAEEARERLMKKQEEAQAKLALMKKLGRDFSKEEYERLKADIDYILGKIAVADAKLGKKMSLAGAAEDATGSKSIGAALGMNAQIQYQDDKLSALGDNATEDDKAAAAKEKLQIRMDGLRTMQQEFAEQMAQFGPEGELAAAISSGTMQMADGFMTAFDMVDEGASKAEAGAVAAAAAISGIAQMVAAQNKAKVAAIDKEIQAEKKRDGSSAASVAKLKQLEKKKDDMKRKAFEQNKKMQMAQIVANTAAGIIGVLSGITDPFVTAPGAVAVAGLIAAMGAAQLAVVSGTSYEGGGSAPSAPSKLEVGQRKNSVDLARGQNAAGEQAYMRGAQGTGEGMTNYKPAFAGYKNRAAGGYVVGEQGPELFMPEVPGSILPAGDTEDIAEAAAPTNVNFTIQAIDSANMEETLIEQRENIIGMIREAANAEGEFFMENI